MVNSISLILRNIFFTIVHPGLVAGFVPYWILGNKINRSIAAPLHAHQYISLLLFVVGLVVLFNCVFRFAFEGRGTLSPADPTKRLVITGLYKFSRNPMYLGVSTMLIAEAVFFQSLDLWIYFAGVFICFNLFIILVEEPRLRRDFGDDYDKYCGKVGRWI